jgi:subtilase family serine protease
LQFELLEDRLALSASIGSFVQALPASIAPTKKPVHATPIGLTPQQIRDAYGFSNVSFGNIVGDGSGQTIAIVDAYNDPNIASDLMKFDQTFGLPDPPGFAVVEQQKGKKLPKDNKGWSQEIALDVEWSHAIAPGANILLVETLSPSELFTGVNFARNVPGVSVVSLSAAANEIKQEPSADSLFTTPYGHAGVTFVVSAGDSGAKPAYPSSSPNVLSVGGTSLSVGWYGQWERSGESVWSAGGGGVSQFEGLPSFQSGLGLATRGTPDVSYDGDPNTGFAVYDSFGTSGWGEFGGTSAGAPQWAALIAIADQGRALGGMGSLANAQAALYSLPRTDFFDVTSGTNGKGSFATTGYDTASGLGSPNANVLIPDLASFSGSTNFTVAAVPPKSKHGKSTVVSSMLHASVAVAPENDTASAVASAAIVDSVATMWGASDFSATSARLNLGGSAPQIVAPISVTPSMTSRNWNSRSANTTSGRRGPLASRQDAAFESAGADSFASVDAYFAGVTGASISGA